MLTFAALKHINTYKKVSFYSVVLEGEESSLFEQFIADHSTSSVENLKLILTNIRNIGEKRGAQTRYFRHEGSAEALPMPTYYLNCEPGDLRLYCSVLSEDVVILFSGNIKTAGKVQDCDNVKPHFKLANLISKQLTNQIKEKNLSIDSETEHRLIVGQEFELWI